MCDLSVAECKRLKRKGVNRQSELPVIDRAQVMIAVLVTATESHRYLNSGNGC